MAYENVAIVELTDAERKILMDVGQSAIGLIKDDAEYELYKKAMDKLWKPKAYARRRIKLT